MSTSTSNTQSKSRNEMYRLMAASLIPPPRLEQPASSGLARPQASRWVASEARGLESGFQDGPSRRGPPWIPDCHEVLAARPALVREPPPLASLSLLLEQ